MPLSLDSALGIHPEAMILRGRRAGILAANLANADTPNYKSRDFDFHKTLARFAGVSGRGMDNFAMQATSTRHITDSTSGMGPDVMYRVPLQPSLDGNTVDSQVEKAEFAENALAYQASLTFLNGKIRGLLTALRGE